MENTTTEHAENAKSVKRKRCGHCDQLLTLPVFKRHKERHYNTDTKRWCRGFESSGEESDEYTDFDELVDNEISQLPGDNSPEWNYQPATMSNNEESDSSDDEPEHWEEEDLESDFEGSLSVCENQCNPTSSESPAIEKLVHLTMLFILLWGCRYGVSTNGLNHLIQYLHHFLVSLGMHTPFVIANVLAYFPTTLHMIKRRLGLHQDQFTKFVICPSCHSLYTFDQCYTTNPATKVRTPKRCSHIEFPNHTQHSRRKPCGHALLREVILCNNKKALYPKKVYCYKSVLDSLSEILGRKGVLDMCEEWRNRQVPADYLGDVFDGRVWHDFMEVNGKPFLAEKNNIGLMLNCDWFRPFSHTEYSVGVMYAVVLNLPRALRFKLENVIIVGIIPGPNEPPLHLNSYLRPLVDELIRLWRVGVVVNSKVVKAALLCVACDLPAAHKICGFTSHSSHHGCSRCNKFFPYDEEHNKMDYSGFSPHAPRQQSEHKAAGIRWNIARTKTAREEIEKTSGSRYTKLNLLPYFDCIRFTIVDPMHNLFLGTSKHLMKKIWLKDELIRQNDMEQIHTIIENTRVPSNVGRLPLKILTGFAGFTADQWKNWSLLYSLVCLHGILPTEHLECWRLFVRMCLLVSTPLISLDDVSKVASLATEFGQTFQELYGRHRVTPNIHLHIHISECILDFGPVYSFWLYSFERYNGILGSYTTNQKSIEIQVMRRFLHDMQVKTQALSFIDKDTEDILSPFFGVKSDTTTSNIDWNSSSWHPQLSLATSRVEQSMHYAYLQFIECLPPFKRRLFDSDSLRYLKEAYNTVLPIDPDKIAASYELYNSISLWNTKIGSKNSRNEKCSYIQAYWASRGGAIDKHCTELYTGQVEFFFRQSVVVRSGERMNIVMAFVKWFQHHPRQHMFGSPVEIWTASMYESLGPASFIPVNRINNLCTASFQAVDRENVIIVTPLKLKVFL